MHNYRSCIDWQLSHTFMYLIGIVFFFSVIFPRVLFPFYFRHLFMAVTSCFMLFICCSLVIFTFLPFTGISLKTQELYALVFVTRYLDIFTSFISFYNTVMKLIFLGSSFSIVWYIRRHRLVRKSYDKDQDTFRHYFLVLPCLILALLIHEKFTFTEVRDHLSILLHSSAIFCSYNSYC